MKNFLRNSRPLPYKTLATGILFNGVIEFTADDFNEQNEAHLNNIKDGCTCLLFNDGLETVSTRTIMISLKNYERVIFDFDFINSALSDKMCDGYSFSDKGTNYISLNVINNSSLMYVDTNPIIDGKKYVGEYMVLFINKIGNLIFISKIGEQ